MSERASVVVGSRIKVPKKSSLSVRIQAAARGCLMRRPATWRRYAARIQAAARGYLVRDLLRPLRAALGDTPTSSAVCLRLVVGKLVDVALLDRVTGLGAPLHELVARYGAATTAKGKKKAKTKATSAKKQRGRKEKADKYSGESVVGADGALYATSGANALDKATLRDMTPGRLARLMLSHGISCHPHKKPPTLRVFGAAPAAAGGAVRGGGA